MKEEELLLAAKVAVVTLLGLWNAGPRQGGQHSVMHIFQMHGPFCKSYVSMTLSHTPLG